MDTVSAFAVLQPHGSVALAERGLMFHAVLFMLIVAVPVYLLIFFFAWRYRARTGAAANAKDKQVAYAPEWEHSKMEELVWWAIPFEIVLVLGALTWSSTHALDPRKPLSSAQGELPLIVEVVALDWKWLFIYPQEGIATLNELYLPVGRSVEFKVTADAPMNSFWIPSLGGQIYAMTGMTTTLHLRADDVGVYRGGSANYSGPGFAKMNFEARALAEEDFDARVLQIKAGSAALSYAAYRALAQPSQGDVPAYYGEVEEGLYDTIVGQFSSPRFTQPDPVREFPSAPEK